ncbi:AbrB/MazE/SpoVT family DNA-binding domain-containing protein [Stenotrophomonas sp. MMGLT7]|uniref:AbrB/MazE/SpoVT family DNA-binding domain-containing protein n=1 Tax=Stenotrophomonas sp. MMGLT7 TaxID=2901227 RepID=UPI001E58D39C|nr:AbrB/MazE/SpoVT family DNA-binding domain-containing protein [Stenotrophomonas sp. MMGLT7]MCD7099232.1 type II toxin-antitoxin system PrlF family antitoxin [Stenotrophomonas sp. MMGLT7]
MPMTSKGQVTIPQDIREALDLGPSSEIGFVREGGRVWLRRRAPGAAQARGLVTRLRGPATARPSTEQIMALTRGETP